MPEEHVMLIEDEDSKPKQKKNRSRSPSKTRKKSGLLRAKNRRFPRIIITRNESSFLGRCFSSANQFCVTLFSFNSSLYCRIGGILIVLLLFFMVYNTENVRQISTPKPEFARQKSLGNFSLNIKNGSFHQNIHIISRIQTKNESNITLELCPLEPTNLRKFLIYFSLMFSIEIIIHFVFSWSSERYKRCRNVSNRV